MVKNIIYVQQNEEIAKSILEGIAGSGYEVFHCVTAAEAFNLMTRQDAPLLMLDINIPDMRLREVVSKCSAEFPATVLAIFTDYPNAELLTKLVNRHGIYKIFVAPWDTAEIVEQIEDAMEYAEIRFERLQREGALILENQEFDTTLSNLKDSLIFQQHSYYKFNAVQNALLRVTTENFQGTDSPEDRQKLFQFVTKMMEEMLRSQTTASLKVNGFEMTIREELKRFPDIKVNGIESCLIGDIPRVMIANVETLILCVAGYISKNHTKCEMVIQSSYLTNTRICLEIHAVYQEDTPMLLLDEPLEHTYDMLLKEMFIPITAAVEVVRQEHEIIYQLQVPISYLD